MRTRFFTLSLPLVAGLVSSAQITLTDADIPAIGDTFIYNTADYAVAPAGGLDVLFDYSGLASTGTSAFMWIDPTVYSNSDLFPDAEMAKANGTDTLFYALTASGLERVGERQSVTLLSTIDLEMANSNPALVLELPLAFGGTWSDQVDGAVYADGNTGTRTGIISGEADATGYVQLPGGGAPVPVLRVRTTIQEVIVVPSDFGDVQVDHARLQHDYYAPFLKMPILTVFTDSLDSQFADLNTSGIRWMDSAPVGLQETARIPMELGLMPNPAEDQVTVQLAANTGANAMLIVCDAVGRVVASERLLSGVQRWQFETSALPAGCYSVTVIDRTGSHGSARLVKR